MFAENADEHSLSMLVHVTAVGDVRCEVELIDILNEL